jgi:sortase A
MWVSRAAEYADTVRRAVRGWRRHIVGIVEVALVTLGAICLGWYGGVRIAAAHAQTVMAHELEITRAPDRALGAKGGRSIPHGSPIGRIEMPRLSLSAVAREGIDERTLDLAIGHVPGTALPGDAGNAAFAAHRDTFFRPLRRVHTGDVVTVNTPRGRFRYIVTTTRVVSPDDVSVLDPTNDATLTLVTCYPFSYIGGAPYRFVVRAELLPR